MGRYDHRKEEHYGFQFDVLFDSEGNEYVLDHQLAKHCERPTFTINRSFKSHYHDPILLTDQELHYLMDEKVIPTRFKRVHIVSKSNALTHIVKVHPKFAKGPSIDVKKTLSNPSPAITTRKPVSVVDPVINTRERHNRRKPQSWMVYPSPSYDTTIPLRPLPCNAQWLKQIDQYRSHHIEISTSLEQHLLALSNRAKEAAQVTIDTHSTRLYTFPS